MIRRRILPFCLLLFASCATRQDLAREHLPSHKPYLQDRAPYEEFFASPSARKITPLIEHIAGGIAPHHLFVGHEIARYYEALSRQKPSVIALIGPNHFSQGKAAIQTTDRDYTTPYGTLELHNELVRALEKQRIAAIEPTTFDSEHAISTHVAFLKRQFPDTPLLPIVVKSGTTTAQATALGEALNALLPRDALVLASVDFSHYQTLDVADFHDAYSRATIEQFAMEHIRKLEIDSAPSIEALLTYLTKRGAQRIAYEEHTNSGEFVKNIGPEGTTSHFYFAFSEGSAPRSPFASLLFLGDTIVDRGIAEALKSGIDPLRSLHGTENRFFGGITVTGLNLEGPLTTAEKNIVKPVAFAFDPELALPLLKSLNTTVASIANNHLGDAGKQGKDDTVASLHSAGIAAAGYPEPCNSVPIVHGTMALCSFLDENDLLDTAFATQAIKAAKEQNDFAVVSVHWGTEYRAQPSDHQRGLAKRFIAAGADAVIGHGPHVVQPFQSVDGKPVYYSLGNFLFDQPDARFSSGLAAMLVFSGSTIEAGSFELSTAGGETRRM